MRRRFCLHGIWFRASFLDGVSRLGRPDRLGAPVHVRAFVHFGYGV